jgi:predicted O-methyltransferase YrrM
MSDRLPDNLEMLYSAFGETVIDSILPGDTFELDGVEFVCKYSPGSTASRFYIVKNLALVDHYRQLCERFTGAAIVELGIAEGGSTALVALLARPAKLIAIDLESVPLVALTEFIDAHGLADVVRPHYGVNQADRDRLGALVDSELGDHPLDLVIDDCSHKYAATRSSFETLFPRLRPGGLFVVEDWNGDHVMHDAVRAQMADTSDPDNEQRVEQFRNAMAEYARTEPDGPGEPLSRLAVELLMARSSITDAIAEVSFDEFWIVARRGTAELDPATFRLSDHYTDHFGFVPPPQSPGS